MELCSRPPGVTAGPDDQWAAAASRALHPARGDVGHLDDDWLLAVAGGLATVTVPWELRDQPDPAHAGELVLATEAYEAWVLTWPAGAVGDWHGHDAPGALFVVAGELDETVVTASGRRRRRRLGPGEGTVFGPSDRHLVANAGATSLTSVHVYTRVGPE